MKGFFKVRIRQPVLSPDLSEEIGIYIGDGSMWIHKRSRVTEYCYCYSSHTTEDQPYREYVKNLINTLYGIEPGYIKRDSTCTTLSYFSKQLVMFKIALGLPLGKKNQISLPSWIIQSNALLTACIRGIFDTDGSLTFKMKHKNYHYYPMIKLTSLFETLINQLQFHLEKFGISVWTGCRTSNPHLQRPNDLWEIFISGRKNLMKFETLVGFHNMKHLSKLKIWKTFGFCPPHTTLEQRLLILDGKIDPYSYY